MIQKIGVQLYTIRDAMKTAEDIRESFRKLKAMGIDQGQTAGCAIPYEEFGKIAEEEQFEIVGTHDNFQMMVEDFDQALANHRALHTNFMGIGGFSYKTSQEVKDFIKQANEVGEKAAKAGCKFTYHHHSHEFMRLDNGDYCMNMLVEGLDPKNTSFVLDTYWLQHGGADVRQWIAKLSGRVDILHLKDMGRGPDGPFITEIGNGNINFAGALEEAEKAGVKYYVIEQDTCPGDPFESLKQSVDYIQKNFMK